MNVTDRLRKPLIDVFGQWAEDLRRKLDYDGMLGVLVEMHQRVGEDGDAQKLIRHFAEESVQETQGRVGLEPAAKLLVLFQTAFSSLDNAGTVWHVCMRRAIESFLDDRKVDEAWAAFEKHKSLLPDDKSRDEIAGLVIDRRGRKLLSEKQFAEALSAYAAGVKQHPTCELLARNSLAAVVDRAKELVGKRDWQGAVGAYTQAIELFAAA